MGDTVSKENGGSNNLESMTCLEALEALVNSTYNSDEDPDYEPSEKLQQHWRRIKHVKDQTRTTKKSLKPWNEVYMPRILSGRGQKFYSNGGWLIKDLAKLGQRLPKFRIFFK